MSCIMRKPAFCICEKGADLRLCFRYIDSTFPLLPKSKIANLLLSSVAVQLGLCPTWWEIPKTDFLDAVQICIECKKSFPSEDRSFCTIGAAS